MSEPYWEPLGAQPIVEGRVKLWDSVDAGATLGVPNLVTPVLPSNYRHLRVVGTLVASIANNGGTLFRINGDAATNRYFGTLSQFRASVSAGFNDCSGVAGLLIGNSSSFGEPIDLLIPNYADVTAGIVKGIMCRKGYFGGASANANYEQITNGFWNLPATVVQTLGFHNAGAANWVAGTRITVYGES